MLFPYNNLMFSYFTWKKKLLYEMVCVCVCVCVPVCASVCVCVKGVAGSHPADPPFSLEWKKVLR